MGKDDPSRLDRAEADNQFKMPDNVGKDSAGDNPPSQGQPGSYQEATSKVDNFSPPEEKSGTSDSFVMPKEETFKIYPSDEEVEDVFDQPQTSAPSPTPVPVEKPIAPSDNRGKPVSPDSGQDEPVSPDSGQGEQKIDIPQEKKGHGCLWAVIILIIIFLMIGGAIFVNEWGVLNLGIEKYYGAIHLERLWGGLPKESKMALASSFNKMKAKSFELEGLADTDLYLASSQDSAWGVWTEGLDLQDEVKIKVKIQNKDKMEMNFTTEVSSDSTAVNNLLAGDSAIDLTTIYDSSDIYLKNETLKRILSLDKDWLKIINNNSETTKKTSASKISDLVTGGERSGSEKINGVSCYIYEVKINNSTFESLVSNYANLGWLGQDASFATAKFYLGKKDHYIHKAEINLTHNPSKATIKSKITLNFKNIGSNIQITVPASDETTKKNWSDIRNTFVSGAVPTATPTSTPLSTPEERDTQRKADLKKIQDALLAYKVQNGKYPSTLGAVEKTRDVTSNLKSALVPKYLESLPVDPESDKYYYGYKSDDGTECELTSILEVKTDPDGEDISGFWIYKLRDS